MIEVKETSFMETDLVIVQIGVSKDLWKKIQTSEEWQKILNGNVSERTEETLQSIDSTLKRIEEVINKIVNADNKAIAAYPLKTKVVKVDGKPMRVPIDYSREDNSSSTES